MTTQHDHATEHRHVLIIGNGFDLQHGFNTRYGDFAKWLDGNNDRYMDNVWSQYVVNVYRQNTTTHDQKTWIDLEKEIERLITSLSKDGTRRFPSMFPLKDMMYLLSNLDDYHGVGYHKRYIELMHIHSEFFAFFSKDPDNMLGLDSRFDSNEDLISFCHNLKTTRPDIKKGIKSKLFENKSKLFKNKSSVSSEDIVSIEKIATLALFILNCEKIRTWQTFKEWREKQSINEWVTICMLTIVEEKTDTDLPLILFQTEKDFIDFLYWQLQRLIAQFESYLQSVFKGIEDQTAIKESPFRLPCDPIPWSWSTTNVVSFNYTHTYQAIGKLRCPTVTAIDDQVIHIHGQMGQHNMVLGTRTMDHPGSAEWHRFHKHTQRMVKDTISRYQDLLADMKKAHKVTIGVVGHSLDTSDHAILKHLLMANPNTRVRVYYHSTDHLVAMNHNITTIMGEDAVSEKVRFICQYDHHDDGSHNPDGVFETKTGVAVGA